MEMVGVEEVDIIGEALTPPLFPLAFSLHDSTLLSHCSNCFSPLTLNTPDFLPNSHHVPSSSPIRYCSPYCSTSDSPIHHSSAAHHLHSLPGDTSDLRTALRLLFHFQKLGFISRNGFLHGRIGGLLSNRDNFMRNQVEGGDDEVSLRIKEGAKAMAAARRKRDGLNFEFDLDCVVEEALLCVVLTNAVEVQDKDGCFVGIAVYDWEFSWINHSCSPNACYWFLQPESDSGASQSRIAPAAMDWGGADAVLNKYKSEFTDECKGCGPRIVVRSIKAIQKGEAVTITYTDLLQPKAMRQSDLWLKYRFTCQCKRCSALPLNYVDYALQSSSQDILENGENEELTDYVYDVIAQFLTNGDAELCCEKLENVLTNGLLLTEQSEENEPIPRQKIKLHPLHHLSLNAYTVLASAYKVRASGLLAKIPETDENRISSFRMNCISAAYSFLLASLTHHLFLSEPSLIASVANFWNGAGESLLNLSRSSTWDLFAEQQFGGSELPPTRGYKCLKCRLLDNFEANFASSGIHISDFEEISRKFLDCVRNTIPNGWSFFVQRNEYLGKVIDTISDSAIFLDCKGGLVRCDANTMISKCKEERPGNEERIGIFHLSVHCLLYGGLLSSICGGKDFWSVRHVRGLVYDEATQLINGLAS